VKEIKSGYFDSKITNYFVHLKKECLKNQLFCLLRLIFLFSPFLVHAQWYQLDSITDQLLNAVSFTDENTGYVAGENGTLFKTTDAGDSWFQLELNTDYNITDMCFPAVDTGYIICNKQDSNGERFKIYKTVNGGTYWTNYNTGFSCQFFDMYFINADTVYCAEANGKTSD
jgi:hypothetical protein